MEQTKNRKLSELNKLEGNPRIIKDDDFKKLCRSIKDNPDYFEARPLILSDRTGELVILAGNQRYEAAKSNGLKEVPTILLKGLSVEREKEILIIDNVNSGDWDYDLLANNWEIEDLANWGVDLPLGLDSDGNYEQEETLYETPEQLHPGVEYILVICEKEEFDDAREHFKCGYVEKENGAKNKVVKSRTVRFSDYVNSNS